MASRAELSRRVADDVTATALGRGCVLVVRGEAGIGKSTLVREAVQGTVRVVWGWCEPLTAASPLLPVADFEQALGRQFVRGAVRHELFRDVLDVMAEQPTAVVVEDVHWADDATLDLLVFLARRVTGRGVALILTHRDHEPSANPRVLEVLAHLTSLGKALEVPPLDLEEVTAAVGHADVDPASVLRISGGNAYFVSELAHSSGRLPASVRESVAGRLSRLPSATRNALDYLSVLPDGGAAEIVCAAAGVELGALDAAEGAGLVRIDGSMVTYRHDLAREAVETRLAGSRRRRVHADLLAVRLSRPGTPDAVLALHADHAGDHRRAVECGLRAGATAMAARAHFEALAHLQLAARHVEAVPLALAAEVFARLGDVLTRLGRVDDAIAAAGESRDRWRRAGDVAGETVQMCRLSVLESQRGEVPQSHRFEREALLLGDRLPGSAAQLAALTNSAMARMLDRDPDGAVATAERAIALARTLARPVDEGIALNALGCAALFAGELARGRAALTRAAELGEETGDESLTSTALVNLGSAAGEMRHYDVAIEELHRCVAWCRERDLDQLGHYAQAWLARIAFETGRWDDAVTLAERAADARFAIVRIGCATVLARVAVRRRDAAAVALLAVARREAAPTKSLQRMWPVLAGECEAAWAAGTAPPEDLPEIFDDAVRARHPWAVGELGLWLARFGLLGEEDPRLAGAAAPYAAALRSEHGAAADAWQELGCPYEAALANAELDDHERLGAAVATLDRLGALADADAVAARLRAAGGTVRRQRRATRIHPAGLTAREAEVLTVLRPGVTDAEIAERLHISTRTVGHHVSAILGKLGVSSRRAAALWAEQNMGSRYP